MKVTASGTSTQLSLTQQSLEATQFPLLSTTGLQTLPEKDRLNISEEAKGHSHKAHATQTLQDRNEALDNRLLITFLRDLLQALSGSEVANLQPIPDETFTELPLQTSPPQMQTVSAELEQTSLSVEMQSFSFSGTIHTKDGQELAFSLELQSTHASFSEQFASFHYGPEGSSFNFAGTAAELTSTSFSFSLASSDPATEGAQGLGRFHLNDELSKVGKVLKPIIKEALGEQSWSETNQLLRTIA